MSGRDFAVQLFGVCLSMKTQNWGKEDREEQKAPY